MNLGSSGPGVAVGLEKGSDQGVKALLLVVGGQWGAGGW